MYLGGSISAKGVWRCRCEVEYNLERMDGKVVALAVMVEDKFTEQQQCKVEVFENNTIGMS